MQNKIISLAIIGLVLGGIVGAAVDSGPANMAILAAVGGIIGFLAGWVWNSRSGGSEDAPSGGSEDAPSGGSEDAPSGGSEDSDSGRSEG